MSRGNDKSFIEEATSGVKGKVKKMVDHVERWFMDTDPCPKCGNYLSQEGPWYCCHHCHIKYRKRIAFSTQGTGSYNLQSTMSDLDIIEIVCFPQIPQVAIFQAARISATLKTVATYMTTAVDHMPVSTNKCS